MDDTIQSSCKYLVPAEVCCRFSALLAAFMTIVSKLAELNVLLVEFCGVTSIFNIFRRSSSSRLLVRNLGDVLGLPENVSTYETFEMIPTTHGRIIFFFPIAIHFFIVSKVRHGQKCSLHLV